MNRLQFILATAGILFVAFCLGWFANWLVHRFSRVTQKDVDELQRLSQELHAAQETRDQAITYLEQREAELTKRLNEAEQDVQLYTDQLAMARQEADQLREALSRQQAG